MASVIIVADTETDGLGAGNRDRTSLLVILAVLVITVVASLIKSRRDPEARAHAGSLRDTRDDRHGPREG
jgi:hypothetical protein